MPAFTTNIEMGMYLRSGKLLYGRPDNAVKVGYLDYSYEKFNGRKPDVTMEDLATTLLKELGQWSTPPETFSIDTAREFIKEGRRKGQDSLGLLNEVIEGENS